MIPVWHINEKIVVNLVEVQSHIFFIVAAHLQKRAFASWSQLQHFSGLSAQSASWKLLKSDAESVLMDYVTVPMILA